jgi:hypothetical protein
VNFLLKAKDFFFITLAVSKFVNVKTKGMISGGGRAMIASSKK